MVSSDALRDIFDEYREHLASNCAPSTVKNQVNGARRVCIACGGLPEFLSTPAEEYPVKGFRAQTRSQERNKARRFREWILSSKVIA